MKTDILFFGKEEKEFPIDLSGKGVETKQVKERGTIVKVMRLMGRFYVSIGLEPCWIEI